jgi:hypothetical protein
MQQIFDPRRFRLYFIKTVFERPVQILGTFALAFTVSVMVYFLIKAMASLDAAQDFSFSVGLVGGGGLLASLVFGFFGDAANGSSFLTLPVSNFERWLCAVLILVIYVTCFLFFFRGIDTMMVHQFHNGLNPQDARYQQQYDSVFIFSFTGEAVPVFIFFTNAVTAMLVGSLYFNKVSFIKVSLVICGIYIAVFAFNYIMSSVLFKDYIKSFPFHSVIVKNGSEEGVVVEPAGAIQIYDVVCTYVLPAFLLVISYIRLREKEI